MKNALLPTPKSSLPATKLTKSWKIFSAFHIPQKVYKIFKDKIGG